KVVAIGPGALRLVCYVNGADKVVGVENVEKQKPRGKPYMLAHPELKELPSIGQGGPDTAPEAERLVTVNPDVIFVASLLDGAQADELQTKTNIPVVVLNYGTEVPFDEKVYDSLLLIGKITGNEKRAQEVVAYLKNCQQDLQERTRDIPDEKKPRVYVGALSAKGEHSIESTAPKYEPFIAIGARNVVEEINGRGSVVIEKKKLAEMGRALGRIVMIEKEKLLAWDPDIILIDEGGLELVRIDYKKNPQFYQSLKAVKTGQVYGQIPFNFYNTNIGTAIADAYYAGKVIFPEQFKDLDPAQKADEIYQFLLGKPLYEQMAKDYGGFKKLDLAVQ
ncbi:MAG: iron ABC transporter substrate-binding protein, partial [Armatimonadetes bacterium]|nr:iron ABC transporter substrate-binding protein [Armatimonadota bacterium]